MNTRIVTITTALLTGTITAGAHPPEQNRQQSQRGAQYKQQQECPACGAPRNGQQRQHHNQGDRQQQSRQRQQQQIQQQVQQLQAHQQQLQQQIQQFQTQQKKRQRFHQKALERFDVDGDGQLSEAERHAMHEAMEKRRSSHSEGAPGHNPE